jgi:hypothetical protein
VQRPRRRSLRRESSYARLRPGQQLQDVLVRKAQLGSGLAKSCGAVDLSIECNTTVDGPSFCAGSDRRRCGPVTKALGTPGRGVALSRCAAWSAIWKEQQDGTGRDNAVTAFEWCVFCLAERKSKEDGRCDSRKIEQIGEAGTITGVWAANRSTGTPHRCTAAPRPPPNNLYITESARPALMTRSTFLYIRPQRNHLNSSWIEKRPGYSSAARRAAMRIFT